MFSLLSNLQRKPEHTRKKIAFVSSVVLTGVIVFFWLVSLSVRKSEPVVVAQDEDTGPFQAVTENVSTFFADVGTAFKGMKEAFSNTSEEVKAAVDTTETMPVLE